MKKRQKLNIVFCYLFFGGESQLPVKMGLLCFFLQVFYEWIIFKKVIFEYTDLYFYSGVQSSLSPFVSIFQIYFDFLLQQCFLSLFCSVDLSIASFIFYPCVKFLLTIFLHTNSVWDDIDNIAVLVIMNIFVCRFITVYFDPVCSIFL